ncbi:PdaC/SigV domain-containing protein [Brevibacillus massiliensis]|nr:DUF4163 domain-containing protein [Brevibacillus massiliensis]
MHTNAFIVDDLTYVPLTQFGQELGIAVVYKPETQRITLRKTGKELVMTVNSPEYSLNGHDQIANGQPLVMHSEVYVPLRVAAENMGYQLAWQEQAKTAIISRIAENSIQLTNKKVSKQLKGVNVSAQYPEIAGGLPDEAVRKKLNALLQQHAEQALTQAENSAKENSEPDGHTWEYQSNYTITYNQRDVLSLYFDNYSYTGGAHGMTDRVAYTINLKTGHVYTLKELLKSNPNYMAQINADIKKQWQERDIPLLTPFTSIAEDQPFYLRGDSVVIYFGLYEYTPYAAGIQEFAIPLASLIPDDSNPFQS